MILFSLLGHSLAQYYSIGNDPSNLKWKQIKSDNYRVIFPYGSEKLANRISLIVAEGSESIGASLKHIPRKYPLILHPFSAISNGYTIWAPRRIELFPRPPVLAGAESYLDHLLIHEVRHMVQMDKLNVGFTKAASYILGEQAVAAVIGLHLPSWFMEGDAVLTETLLTNSGRGRQPLFSQDLRALWLENKVYPFDKSMFGSYKDFVPNHYVMGYQLVSMSRLLGGESLWPDILDKMGRRPYTVSLLSRNLKKKIGLNKRELYYKTNSWTTNYWSSGKNDIFNPSEILPFPANKGYSNYYKPIKLSDGDLICLKTTLSKIPEFVMLSDQGEEKHLFYPGYVESGSFSIGGSILIWAEENPDLRWENRSYSNLYAFHTESGRKWQITRNRRFFSPNLDEDGSLIVCLVMQPDGTNLITILNIKGELFHQSSPAPDSGNFQTPVWGDQGEIYTLTTGPDGKSLYTYDYQRNEFSLLRQFGWKEVNNMVFNKGQIYFNAPWGSVNAIYQYDIEHDRISLLSSNSNGYNYLSVYNDSIYTSANTTDGYKPSVISIDHINKCEVSQVADLNEPFLELIDRYDKEYPLTIADTVPVSQYRRYRKALNWFNFHSWAPASLNVDTYSLKPGFMLMTQNELSSVLGQAGIEYDMNFKRIEEFLSLDLSGRGPKVDVSVRTYKDSDQLTLYRDDTIKALVNYRTYQGDLGINYPMNFSSGRWFRNLTPFLQVVYTNYTGQTTENNIPYSREYLTIRIGIGAYSISRKAHRDLYPRLGYMANLSTIAQGSFFERIGKTYLTGSLQTYLPGLAQNHSFRLYMGGYFRNEWMLPDQPPILLPRGLYSNFNQYHVSGKIDYAFPFWYPDWNLRSLIYIKRFKANIFYDTARNMLDVDQFFMSAGIDLTSDFYLFRIGAEIDAGIRIIYNFSDEKIGTELLFNFDLN